MATKNIVPRADSEGNFGTAAKRWLKGFFKEGIYYDSTRGIRYNSSTGYWQYNNGNEWVDFVGGADEKVKVYGDDTAAKLHEDYFVRDSEKITLKDVILDGSGTIRAKNLLGKISTLTPSSGSVVIPMNSEALYTVEVGSNTSLSFSIQSGTIPSGYAAGVVVIIYGASTSCTLSYSSNWKWSGGSLTTISSDETISLSLLNYGSSDNNVIASTAYLT